MNPRLLTMALVLTGLLAGYASPAPAQHLAIANGSRLRVVDAATSQLVVDVTRYSDVTRLAYRPDGNVLAVGECRGNRVVELDSGAGSYAELAAPLSGGACPWDVTYAPDGQSLAATIPVRPNPLGALFGHLKIAGPQPLDVDLGRPLLAVAYRPGGGEIAVATPTGIIILGPGPAYATLVSVPTVVARALEYTTDGSYLIAGTGTGFVALDATQGYATAVTDTSGAVLSIAVAQSGGWLALVRANTVSVRRTDLREVASVTSPAGFRAADFSRDGTLLAVAEPINTVRLFRAPAWTAGPTITATGRIDAVAFRPQSVAQRLPVLFVHGAESGAGTTWFEPGTGTSVAAALAANPQLPIDAFYAEMELHTTAQPHGVEDDALDIQAMIEGGIDSRGRQQVGILNMPAYSGVGRVAIVGYSLGTMTSRYYIKNLMGSRLNGAITVSEFVTLASPNHGITLHGIFPNLTACGVSNQQDRIARQLCGGARASLFTDFAACGCRPFPPLSFTSNAPGDATFLADLNGHALADSCRAQPSTASEAPRSRPTEAAGVLYVNLYAAGNADPLVGGHTDSDCAGRRLARNLAPDAINEEIAGVPGVFADVHVNFPHHWEAICMALRTATDHQAPALAQACTGLTHP